MFTCAAVSQFTDRADVDTTLLTGDYTRRNFTGAGSTGAQRAAQSLSEIRRAGDVVYTLGVTVCMPVGYHTHIHCRVRGECVSVRRKWKDGVGRLLYTKCTVRLRKFGP